MIAKNRKVAGVGTNDYEGSCTSENVKKAYSTWVGMLQRCYSNMRQNKQPTYVGCSVCEEWLSFNNFREWFGENYVEGFDLDKDIMIEGNKVYSPETCRYVPKKLNTSITIQSKGRLPTGVHSHPRTSKFQATLRKHGKPTHLGMFNTEQSAFEAWRNAKIEYIRELATIYLHSSQISIEVFNAIISKEFKKDS